MKLIEHARVKVTFIGQSVNKHTIGF